MGMGLGGRTVALWAGKERPVSDVGGVGDHGEQEHSGGDVQKVAPEEAFHGEYIILRRAMTGLVIAFEGVYVVDRAADCGGDSAPDYG
jgi:hypothetical protein